jgi:hypothetical protein
LKPVTGLPVFEENQTLVTVCNPEVNTFAEYYITEVVEEY